MYEIDKTAFGQFISELRKEKGFTQKDLAGKLFVSDKAVSKWERGLSLPDISILLPLAEILGVTITELLDSRKLDTSSELDTLHVEDIVKKAINLSEDTPSKKKEKLFTRAYIFGSCVIMALLTIVIGLWYLDQVDMEIVTNNMRLLEGFSFVFGIYFWFFIKERLPVYYDENKVSAYNDGVFRMNLPGVNFNNSNWPYIVKCGRMWTAITIVTVPAISLLLTMIAPGLWWSLTVQNTVLILYFLGLFIPLLVTGRKYG